MRKIRTYHEVEDAANEDIVRQVVAQRERLAERLATVDRIVPVASGKGGVGKSAITANLAAALARSGARVGALDGDLNGPSLARMLHVEDRALVDGADGIGPPEGVEGVRVMSMELLQDEGDRPLGWRDPGSGHPSLWRGILEGGATRELLSDVAWGELDWLLVDLPPGTDRIGRFLELVPEPAAVLLVTTPSEMARAVVARSARLLREEGVERVGLVSNMTDWICPDCGSGTPVYPDAADERLARETDLEIWGRIPFDPRLARSTDRGRPFVLADPDAPAAEALRTLAHSLAGRIPTPRRGGAGAGPTGEAGA